MITLVSGLPRSGTSLVMQMLAAGGHPILCDDMRPPDDDNPRGYLESVKVKSLEHDATWLLEAEGKAVKIISFLLAKLPADFEYRVIFLRRELVEVLRSQSKMLQRCGQPAGPSADLMAIHFNRHLQNVDEWLDRQKNIQVLNCPYAALIHDAKNMSETICGFLNYDLDVKKMAEAVEPALHRQRVT
ncbi:MAG: sulfotransferase family protein [Planctomycetota bacterium]|nr:sulfotransferase family protein [Planctomycetota bacterium]